MDHRDDLKELLLQRSIRLGDFTLASGSRSAYYVDARRTTMSAEGQFLTGKVCCQALRESDLVVDHVGGLTMGADPVAYAMAHRSWLDGTPLDAFSVRKRAKEHGTAQRVEGGVRQGARCLVVEDSMTTGGSALQAARVLEEIGAEVIAVLTLVDREEGGREHVETSGYPLISIFSGPRLREAAEARS